MSICFDTLEKSISSLLICFWKHHVDTTVGSKLVKVETPRDARKKGFIENSLALFMAHILSMLILTPFLMLFVKKKFCIYKVR